VLETINTLDANSNVGGVKIGFKVNN